MLERASIERPVRSSSADTPTRALSRGQDPMQTMSLTPFQTTGAHANGGFERTLSQASLRRVEAKEFVFAEGDPTTHVFRVETGAVALYKILSDGRRQIVGFAYPGDLIGLGAQ